MKYDFVIVGAGIVGLTLALELKKRHPHSHIALCEKEDRSGRHASGRNSGVLHSGIYYKEGTLKAKLCANGAKRLRAFSKEHQIEFNRSGKIIVAVDEKEEPVLDELMKNAKANGVTAHRMSPDELRKIEPNLGPCRGGIHCPDVGVIDSTGVLETLVRILKSKDVQFFFNHRVTHVDMKRKSVKTNRGMTLSYGTVVNCAGTYADEVAHQFGIAKEFHIVPFKGIYLKLNPAKSKLINASIYPVPDPELPFLGVHLTKNIMGDVTIGPTAIPAFGRENYGLFKGLRPIESIGMLVQMAKLYLINNQNFRNLVQTEIKKYNKDVLIKAVQRLVPIINKEDLISSSKVGIRAQLVNKQTNMLVMDYMIKPGPDSLHILNAVSPGFTSAFAFSEFVADQLTP